ncbi:tetratricopeptide repeat protein [Psychroserpens sp. NJDZ02]|uniref:tetratricopeptide repeat protein n=1 Tax=Psychroserpens sp. NJDZ02 TaxID=2570561 RepID=UPI0010A7A4DD|nr:tetratricopeptide repeat protein [Psychroserpens sp. NJDZ02]QCE41110.1 tetratricopeptide repeat protein [Psychroserpens sp. NJDZ02]
MKPITVLITLLISSIGFAQDNSEKIVDVAYDACDCIGDINNSLSTTEKSIEIKSCITAANMAWQLSHSMSEVSLKVTDTLSQLDNVSKIDSLIVPTDNLNITLVSDSDYEEIEAYLLETCGDMETMYFAENDTTENSYSDKDKAMEYYNQGLAAFDNQDYSKAVTLYKKAVKEDKTFAFAWDNLGRTYRELGDYKEAIKCYKKSIKIDPKGGMPLMNIAVAYGYLEEFDKAKKAYRQYGKVFENDPETYFGLGRIYALDNDFENALDNMMQAYLLYAEINSPYIKDAEKFIEILYHELEKQDKVEAFNRIAEKYKIQILED